jgi:hypothetical protein
MNPRIIEELAVLAARLHTDDNAEQLETLIKEANIILDHTIQPSQEWYRDRLNYIRIYRALDWDHFIRSEHPFIHHTTIQLVARMVAILMQAEIGIFSLQDYQYVLYNVKNVWTHYKKLDKPNKGKPVDTITTTLQKLSL